ncbi:phage major tail protein, TP901-1 family [Enterococcus sp. AZ102]|uniref:phage major tail protein, TP901-1 family n=1 Tax=Enterococcus sp. AZ102 TaxID=2774865 RepID=UPI003F1EB1B4
MAIKQGKDIILGYRILEEANSTRGRILAYQTEHTFNMSRSSDATPTKDGNVQKIGEIEYDFSSTALYEREDPTVDMLYQAFNEKKEIEVAIIDRKDLQKNEENKYKSKYVHAFITSFEEPAVTEDNVAISLTYAVNLKHRDGYTTLTPEEVAEANAQYEFVDILQNGTQGGGE